MSPLNTDFRRSYQTTLNRSAKVLYLLTCIREVPVSDIGRSTDYLQIFVFSSASVTNSWILRLPSPSESSRHFDGK